MAEENIKLYGANWCPDCRRSKAFLGQHRIPYEYLDIEQDTDAQEYVKQLNDNKQIIPTIVFADGSILVEPSDAELAAKLGLQTTASKTFYNLIIVGSGPAGLTAALYAAREGIDTLLVDRSAVGGQAGTTELIENYPGFPGSIGGAELTERMQEQALSFGVEILQAQDITEIASDGRYRTIKTASGDEYRASALLLALGTTYLRLNVPGEEDFIGAGIHFCATCDGPFYRDKDVLVIGGGNSGLQESMFLTRFAKKITILERGEQLGASQILQDKVAELPQIEVRLNSTVEEFKGDGHISGVTVKDVKSGEVEELKPDGVFVFIGLKPNTAFLNGAVELDRWGFITTDKTLQTSVPGIFAAGDVREGSTKQIASATGEGATAALMIRQYLEEQ
ncbi:MAG: thioredoxin-disulfide reductase [Chloroflexi bacterium]|nr:thioredoxin-disulfide reductase [Chloroflexota bacterium]PKB56936.1 MAG: thioredoxin-disulfide reductase [SAR202 cluster bacterium Casp-Chloro-G3]